MIDLKLQPRNKEWRQTQEYFKEKKRVNDIEKQWLPEKNWKLLYTRSCKLHRAKQLGQEYPSTTLRQKLDNEMPMAESKTTNLLFICSRNQWRSPTAEKIWQKHPTINTRSAGTSPRAKKTVTAKDIQWADIIFVMENKHRERLRAEFSRLLDYKELQVLDIPDDYKFMDEELIEILRDSVVAFLGIN